LTSKSFRLTRSVLTAVVAFTAMAAPSFAQAAPPAPNCATADVGAVRCLSHWQSSGTSTTRSRGTVRAFRSGAADGPVEGLRPADIRSAYDLPESGAGDQTVAIVDAFDNPRTEKDLAVYRAAFGMAVCTTANGCFRKVDQRGGTDYPEPDAGWGVEIALDVQAVSATCAQCRILLVEADDASIEAIGTAVNTAVRLGADVVSNSYGVEEFAGIAAAGRRYYSHPGVPIVAASGDSGFGAASFPAVLANTWAVGGTTLSPTNAQRTRWTEEAWSGAGSGCSAWIAKPQRQIDGNCSMRTVSDVSAVADSAEGFAVYDSYGLDADNGWIVVRGTSLSAPLVAGMIALAGNARAAASPGYAYAHRSGLKDVTGGSNGYCGDDYLCTGVRGYDGPTGLGSPRGLKSL
jgi:subtilase family serine protease